MQAGSNTTPSSLVVTNVLGSSAVEFRVEGELNASGIPTTEGRKKETSQSQTGSTRWSLSTPAEGRGTFTPFPPRTGPRGSSSSRGFVGTRLASSSSSVWAPCGDCGDCVSDHILKVFKLGHYTHLSLGFPPQNPPYSWHGVRIIPYKEVLQQYTL